MKKRSAEYYDYEFMVRALIKINSGVSVDRVSKMMSVPKNTLYRWKKAAESSVNQLLDV